MYIDGHIDITNEVLHDPKFENYFFNVSFKHFTKENLLKGLAYVDKPCGEYVIENNKVLFHKKTLCELTQLFKLTSDKHFGESNIFQYHKGFFAHLHSMTTDPLNNVEKIRNKIILSILGYCLLALYDKHIFDKSPELHPNITWIGMILHIIQDSYSPAHTIRDKKYHVISYDPNKINDIDKAMRLRVHENIKALAKFNRLFKDDILISELIKKKLDDEEQKYIMNNTKDIFNIYKIFKFEYDTNKVVNNLVGYNITSLSSKKIKGRDGDIIDFQYYDKQPLVLHSKLDLMYYVRQNQFLYKKMKDECAQVLILYKKALKSGDAMTFLKKLIKLLFYRVYRIDTKYLKDITNKVVTDK